MTIEGEVKADSIRRGRVHQVICVSRHIVISVTLSLPSLHRYLGASTYIAGSSGGSSG
jgi:hypothetical protein